MRSGDRLGPYEIISQLGAGGMGEVYRARDTRLAREVAIKILPAEFSNKKDRLERFEQEARSASALNHPNIIMVFDIGSQDSSSYIAMEFVDGKTLRELLDAGGIPLRKTVSIAAQFADGLAKAHAAGIIHRDLKPENLMISQDGFVKILDFGLAKSSELPSIGGSVLSTLAKTGEGTILGTVGYMSPEQASGKHVDFRSDQFSFGSILYEMITSKRAFSRNTAVQSLSAIIQEEPEPIGNLSPQTPAPIRWIIERCLAKDPEERYASTRDLARELQNVRDHFSDLGSSTEISGSAPVVVHRKWNWRVAIPWILFSLIGILLGVQLFKSQPAPRSNVSPRNVEIAIPPGQLLATDAPLIFAPDGSSIVFGTTRPAMGGAQLWLRKLDRFETVALEGTQGAAHPFWSPDSKSIAFFVDGEAVLKRFDLESRTIQIICKTRPSGLRLAGFARGGSWGADGTILFTPNANSPIQRVPATGGEPVDVTKLDPSILDGSHRYPVFLPDGQHFIFTLWSNHAETASKVGGIYLGSMQKGSIKKLSTELSQAVLAGDNQLLVIRNGGLVALPFDSANFNITGEGKEIVSNPLFQSSSGALSASASRSGDLAYALAAGQDNLQLSWLDNTGRIIGPFGHQRLAIKMLVMSQQDTRFAAQMGGRSGAEIWIGDTKREILARLTRGGWDATFPIWSPDESRIAFAGQEPSRTVSIYIQPADGSSPPQVLFTSKDRVFLPTAWSNDGRYLLVDSNTRSLHGEIWLYDFSEKKVRPILSDPSASVDSGSLSPDGHWLTYVSDESGNKEIFVRPFPALDRKWQLSTAGGTAPHWRNDGGEIIFTATDQSIQSVKIEVKENNLEATAPVLLFASKLPMMAIAPSSDHKRFLAAVLPSDVRAEPIHLILGWKH